MYKIYSCTVKALQIGLSLKLDRTFMKNRHATFLDHDVYSAAEP